MKDRSEVFQLMGETSGSIFPLAQPMMQSLFEEYFTEQRFYQVIFMAYNRAPEMISAALFQERNPYANPAGVEELLEGAAEAGYIKPDGSGGYLIADRGRIAIEAVHETFYKHINQVNRFPSDKLGELIDLLSKLVESTGKSDLKGGKLCFDLSHGGHIQVEAGTLAEVDQMLDDLNAFRDDAHHAAWKLHESDGHLWEVLSFIWNEEATTAEKLAERLPYRQFTVENYQKSLERLTQKGWIEDGEKGFKITAEGKKIRDQAESATDDNYFEPWKTLTDPEINQLGELLMELRDTNRGLVDRGNQE